MGETIATVSRRDRQSRVFASLTSIGLVALTGAAVFAASQPVYLANLGMRAAAETTITICAIAAAVLLVARFRHTRSLRDLLLLAAFAVVSVTDFPGTVMPALVGLDEMESAVAINVVAQTLVALAFVAAAFAPARRRIDWSIRKLALVGLGVAALLAASQLGPLLAHGEIFGSAGTVHAGAAVTDPVLFATRLEAILLMALAGLAFARRGALRHDSGPLLAGAALLLAASRVQYLAIPVVAPDWLTPGTVLRVAAYGLLVAFAIRQYARTRQQRAEGDLRAQRERIARDLHDGIAQDLAFIVAHRERLSSELGPEHPVFIAAGRALEASRGTMVDLAASAAPTTEEALRDVARELESRSKVQINVRADGANEPDFSAAEREEVVRIAREAMVNAVKHGHARHIDVTLERRGNNFSLRVADDGCGIADAARSHGPGFGLPTIRARAASMGGRMTAHRRAGGGTVLEIQV